MKLPRLKSAKSFPSALPTHWFDASINWTNKKYKKRPSAHIVSAFHETAKPRFTYQE
jgi:hypothetical protein